jgi:hypothetical protein
LFDLLHARLLEHAREAFRIAHGQLVTIGLHRQIGARRERPTNRQPPSQALAVVGVLPTVPQPIGDAVGI